MLNDVLAYIVGVSVNNRFRLLESVIKAEEAEATQASSKSKNILRAYLSCFLTGVVISRHYC